jgi:hypothetical protein
MLVMDAATGKDTFTARSVAEWWMRFLRTAEILNGSEQRNVIRPYPRLLIRNWARV